MPVPVNRRNHVDRPPAILLCDEPAMRERLAATLAATGYPLGAAGRRPARGTPMPLSWNERAVMLVVDLGRDPGDGLDWCRYVRRQRPWVLLCAVVREPDAALEVTALEQGADAVVDATISPRRLAAQLGALARRRGTAGAVEDLALDPLRRRAIVSGRPLELTDAEYELLAVLYRHRGSVITRDELSRELHGRPHDAADRSLDLRVTRLRRKLGDDTQSPHWIRSVRGESYVLLPASA